jgi:glucose-1-phosphate adenylyltransferase
MMKGTQAAARLAYGAVKHDPHGPLITQFARDALAIVLAGGRGSRLGPLTDWRAKPAVPFGGKFRIIDFTLSNCVNSGIRRIGICTQYKAQSLIRHVQRGWSFLDGRFGEFVELLPAQQRVTVDWYKGTADAVYQNLDILRRHAPRYVLILAGDHVYKMNYAQLLAEHVSREADISIGCVQVPLATATQYGVLTVDEASRVIGFEEKPAQPKPASDRNDSALASMGIYVFNASFLYEQMIRDADDPRSSHDFGKDVIPNLIDRGYRAFAHRFADSCVNTVEGRPYWRDVGTIDAYWEANLDLTHITPELNLYDEEWPIWSYQEQLPPAKFVFEEPNRCGAAFDSLVSGGCIVSGSSLRRSLLFSNVHVHSYCTIEDSVILPDVEVQRHVTLKNCVVDRYCTLPEGLTAGIEPARDRKRFFVTDRGVTLITPEMLGNAMHHLR